MTRILHLVTTPRPFFDQQVSVLERNGVACTVLRVPPAEGTRSLRQYVRFYARVLRRVAVDEFDAVHANYGLVAPAALAQPVRPVVLSLWGSDLLGRYGWVSRRAARRCDAVVVMSGEMADELGGDCAVVPHGIDLDRFRPLPADAARDEVGWSRDAAHVVFPYDPDRDVKDYPRAERVVAAARDRVAGEVELHAVHGVPHDRVPWYLNAADALLLTSKREGSPNAVREAVACNVPVVATDVGDVADRLAGVSPSPVCATDADLVDGLVSVLDSDRTPSGRDRAAEFSLERTGDRLLSVYRDVGIGPE